MSKKLLTDTMNDKPEENNLGPIDQNAENAETVEKKATSLRTSRKELHRKEMQEERAKSRAKKFLKNHKTASEMRARNLEDLRYFGSHISNISHYSIPPADMSINIKNTEQLDKFSTEIRNLRNRLAAQSHDIQAIQMGAQEKEKKFLELETTYTALQEKERLGFLLNRVNEAAQRILLQSEQFRSRFLNSESCNVFVISVDIRRSTELMLKARSPKQFADFIATLCKQLIKIVLDNYGVIDKFTGDGILAFFPDFYSGEDAGYYALNTAALCHQVFKETYKTFRNSFISVLNDVGLGIGIDYGIAHLVQMADGLTVVGVPVVYACRMAGVDAGTTLLNQPAYEIISEQFSEYFFISEKEIEIKHEGPTVAYTVMPSGKFYIPQNPDWISSQQETE